MSTISSNADLSTRYHRVASEYAKLRAQIPVLKNAVLDEQSRTKHLTEEIHAKESALRKLETENESLGFRNGQLLKRVEALQALIDQSKQSASGKKRAVMPQNSGHFEHSKIDSSLLEGELLVKVRENERLHSKIFELESMRQKDVSAWSEKCAALQKENDSLRIQLEQLVASSIDREQHPVAGDQPATSTQILEVKNQMAGVSGEGVSLGVAEETGHVLVLDALRSAHIVLASFAALLRLLEQRSTIYPNDMSIEVLPDSTKLFGSRLLHSVELAEKAGMRLEDVTHEATDNDSVRITNQCLKLAPIITDAFSSTMDWKELFSEGVHRENRLSWAGPNLCRCNKDWLTTFSNFLDSLLALSVQFRDEHHVSVHSFLAPMEKLRTISSECVRVFSEKVFDENRMPTASKRLRCVNECIEKCLGSLAKNIANLGALLSLIDGTANTFSWRSQLDAIDAAHIACDPTLVADEEQFSKEHSQQLIQREQVVKESDSLDATTPQINASHSRYDSLRHELECATNRVLELEKEREHILVEAELLRMKLAAVPSTDKEEHLKGTEKDELELLGVYYEKRVGELLAESQFARSRANYYRAECEDLLRKTRLVLEEKEILAGNLADADCRIALLNDDLETTRKGYEDQMRNLYEHLGELNTRIENQTDTITSLRETSKPSNGVAKQSSRKLLFK